MNNEEFEKLAKEFYQETGFLAPGKDTGFNPQDREEVIKTWGEWLKTKEHKKNKHKETK